MQTISLLGIRIRITGYSLYPRIWIRIRMIFFPDPQKNADPKPWLNVRMMWQEWQQKLSFFFVDIHNRLSKRFRVNVLPTCTRDRKAKSGKTGWLDLDLFTYNLLSESSVVTGEVLLECVLAALCPCFVSVLHNQPKFMGLTKGDKASQYLTTSLTSSLSS